MASFRKSMVFALLIACLTVMPVFAAGQFKPTADMNEATYSVLSSQMNEGHTLSSANLWDGKPAASGSGNEHDTTYLYQNTGDYVELEILSSSDIWTYPHNFFPGYDSPLTIEKYDGSQYVQYKNETAAAIPRTYTWNKSFSDLLPGKYRIKVKNIEGQRVDGEWFVEGTDSIPVDPQANIPQNLVATSGSENINLNWSSVAGATNYKVLRSLTSDGPYIEIASPTNNNYSDVNVSNNNTYYYVVSSVINNITSSNSNEVVGTLQSSYGSKAIIEIEFLNGKTKEYDLTNGQLNEFVTWFDQASDGLGKTYYFLPINSNIKPFNGRKEAIQFKNIESFEIKDYNE